MSRADNPQLAGKSFESWPTQIKRDVLSYKLSVLVLPPETEDRDILEIFARLNSTGLRLNAQELRNAEYSGAFKRLMYQLGYEQFPLWKSWKILTDNDIARMVEVELTSDLVITMMDGIKGRTKTSIDGFYSKYDGSFEFGEEIERRFRWVFDSIDDLFGRQLPNLVFSNQTMFHALFSYCYDQAYGLGSEFKKRQPKSLPRNFVRSVDKANAIIKADDLPEDLREALAGRTTHLASREARFNFLKQVCEGAYNNATV